MADQQNLAIKTKRWLVGDVRVTRVVEGSDPVDAGFFIEGATREFVKSQAWLRPHFATEDGQIIMVRQAFVVESHGRRIVVDTCVGNDKHRGMPKFNQLQTSFLSDLAAAGFGVESVDTVLCTHLHVDPLDGTRGSSTADGYRHSRKRAICSDGRSGRIGVPTMPARRRAT